MGTDYLAEHAYKHAHGIAHEHAWSDSDAIRHLHADSPAYRDAISQRHPDKSTAYSDGNADPTNGYEHSSSDSDSNAKPALPSRREECG